MTTEENVLIAGVSSGIGRAAAEKLLTNHYGVVGLARRSGPSHIVSKNYISYSVDFSEIKTLESTFKIIQKKHSNIQTIICSVGYGMFGELEQFSVKSMQRLLDVNFLSQVILIKTFLSSLKKKKSGKFIVIGSECALTGYKKASLYCATKFALRGFIQSLRAECATSRIGVTLINPGIVDTPFFNTLSFSPKKDKEYSITAQQMAEVIYSVIQAENNFVYEEINLRPMKQSIQIKKETI